MKLRLLGLLAVAAPGQSDDFTCMPDDVTNSGRPAVECVLAEAKKLEASQEPARDVAAAAVSSCNPAFVSFRSALVSCSGGDLSYVRALQDRLEEIARTVAVREVVKMRAAKARSDD